MKTFKIVCNTLLVIVMVSMAIIAGIMIIPKLMGYESLAVLSGSMTPKIPVGSIVFIKDIESDELAIGDVITYRLDGTDTKVTHRITQIDTEEKQVITKGDANESEDAAPVLFSNIEGRMKFHLPAIGYASIYIKTPLGIAFACGIIITLIVLIYLPEVLSSEDDEKENKDKGKVTDNLNNLTSDVDVVSEDNKK